MISAQVRGQLRRFKTEASARRDALEKVLASQSILTLSAAYCGGLGEPAGGQRLNPLTGHAH
jgi:hypothetical protein